MRGFKVVSCINRPSPTHASQQHPPDLAKFNAGPCQYPHYLTVFRFLIHWWWGSHPNFLLISPDQYRLSLSWRNFKFHAKSDPPSYSSSPRLSKGESCAKLAHEIVIYTLSKNARRWFEIWLRKSAYSLLTWVFHFPWICFSFATHRYQYPEVMKLFGQKIFNKIHYFGKKCFRKVKPKVWL